MAKKYTDASDDRADKKAGIKENSRKDKALDKKRGVSENDAKRQVVRGRGQSSAQSLTGVGAQKSTFTKAKTQGKKGK